MARLIDYAPYRDIRRLMPKEVFLTHGEEISGRIRSKTGREGMNFLRQRSRERCGGG